MPVEARQERLGEDLLQFDGVEGPLVLARLLHRVRGRRVVPGDLVEEDIDGKNSSQCKSETLYVTL